MNEEEIKREEEFMANIKSRYVSIIDKNEQKYQSKMIGLNPNMRPSYA